MTDQTLHPEEGSHKDHHSATKNLPRKRKWPIPPPPSCPIGWQPNALTPVFYGHRDYTTNQGTPANLRVFFPSLDGSPASGALLAGCGRYPLVLFIHGSCPGAVEHYKVWLRLPAQLARAGYVVAALDVPESGTDPATPNHPALPAIAATLTWMRQTWEYREVLMAPPATAIIGHSYGALLSGRFALQNDLSAYVSLSGVWGNWDIQAGGPKPIDALGIPMLFIHGGSDLLTTMFGHGQWEKLNTPKHRIIFENGMHWDYLPEGTTPCDRTRGTCKLVDEATADFVTMFLARYLPPELAPHLPDQIPDSLTPPPLVLTPEQEFYAGSYLNGVAGLSGNNKCGFTQESETDPSRFIINNFGYEQGWRVDQHPRFVTDLTGDRRSDIVGFGDDGVWTSLNNGNGSFQPPRFVLANFGYKAGNWRVDKHLRLMANLTRDERADIVGFGDDGVWTALNGGNGTFQAARLVINDFGYNQGWRVDKHPRLMVDLNGDFRDDFVGFGNHGVWIAISNSDGTFQPTQLVLQNFGFNQGWRVDKHPRFVAKITGDFPTDIVGFFDDGVWLATGNGNGNFQPARRVINNFGYNQGWRVNQHPRFLADLTGEGRADVVGFGNDGVWTCVSAGNGNFQPPRLVLNEFGFNQGWRVDRHPRFLVDLTGDRTADIIGFGDDGVYVAMSRGDGTFHPARRVIKNFSINEGGWRVDRHPRFVANLTTDRAADIIGFGDQGVWIALNKGNGTF
ncbi:FG-GAP repeat domain-containing protein [Telluribacter humicola]|uniref:FG-GAP repeat domain-containing protein n=1 Tax=Telluribacter humicola TaxID=1720261 RepID=UPI001A957BC6|nr:VCBS repeat-containing protein [Telluribacter humicola]